MFACTWYTPSLILRPAHNSFARSDPFEHTRDPDDNEKEDAYHFIAYIPINGELFELDGLQSLPISHGPVNATDTTWTDRAKEVIEGRIASYGGSEINFNLMAITSDQVKVLQKRLEAAQATTGSAAAGDTGTDLAGDVNIELLDIQGRLQEELAKRERWDVSRLCGMNRNGLLTIEMLQFDNTMRRHNHLGLVHALLVELAQAGKLEDATAESKKALKERQEKARERAKLAGEAS